MRQYLGMAFLGATLAFSPSLAHASDTVDYAPSYQRTQSEPVVSRTVIRTEVRGSVAGGGGSTTAPSVYRQLREVNMEGGKAGR